MASAIGDSDPRSEEFEAFQLPRNPTNVKQILGRRCEVWLPKPAAHQPLVFSCWKVFVPDAILVSSASWPGYRLGV